MKKNNMVYQHIYSYVIFLDFLSNIITKRVSHPFVPTCPEIGNSNLESAYCENLNE